MSEITIVNRRSELARVTSFVGEPGALHRHPRGVLMAVTRAGRLPWQWHRNLISGRSRHVICRSASSPYNNRRTAADNATQFSAALKPSMVTPQIRRFNARIELFSEARGFIERFCANSDVNSNASAKLILILEELFTNTVEHGYPGVQGGVAEWPIWLTLTAARGGIETVYEDAAVAHDPFAKVAMPDYSGPAENWRVGGLGIILVTTLGRDLHYERTGGRNRICFTLPTLQSET